MRPGDIQITSLEEHVELDSVPSYPSFPGEINYHDEDDYSGYSSRRSQRPPLQAHDELDQVVGGSPNRQQVGNHRGWGKKRRPYLSSDTVNL